MVGISVIQELGRGDPLRFSNLPLNGFCGIHFSLAHLAEMVLPYMEQMN